MFSISSSLLSSFYVRKIKKKKKGRREVKAVLKSIRRIWQYMEYGNIER